MTSSTAFEGPPNEPKPGSATFSLAENLSFHDIALLVSRIAEQDKTVITVPDAARYVLGLYSNSRFARRCGDVPQLNLDRRYAYQNHLGEGAT